jgi:cysteine-rich repeat protein
MRYLLTTAIASALFAMPAYAANVTCTVPAAQVSRAVELCEALRIDIPVRAADWSLTICANELLRRGLRQFEASYTKRTAVANALDTNLSNHPSVAIRAFCGDGTVDTEFGEECDDGNTDAGDGCDSACQNEE